MPRTRFFPDALPGAACGPQASQIGDYRSRGRLQALCSTRSTRTVFSPSRSRYSTICNGHAPPSAAREPGRCGPGRVAGMPQPPCTSPPAQRRSWRRGLGCRGRYSRRSLPGRPRCAARGAAGGLRSLGRWLAKPGTQPGKHRVSFQAGSAVDAFLH
jgi:hypothetical protein